MTARPKPENTPVNSNVNNNTIHVNIDPPQKRAYKTTKKKQGPDLLKQVLTTGLIALALLLLGYYLMQNPTAKKEYPTTIQPNTTAVEGQKVN